MDTVGTYTVNYFIDDPSGNSSLSKEYIVHVVDYSLINFNVVEINVDHANSNELPTKRPLFKSEDLLSNWLSVHVGIIRKYQADLSVNVWNN